MYEGIRWLTPDLIQLKKTLREAFNGKVQREEKAKGALETAKKFTWENSARKIINLI
jgi:glycosyltransferase involved in cell wall biosynthesis